MTREQIKQQMSLEDAIQVFKDVNCYGTMDIAKSVILEHFQQESKWIPVSERLPLLGVHGISNDVLITNGFEIDMGYLVKRGSKIFWHYYGSEYEFGIKDEDNDATAWMPLPAPYKAESEDK